MSIPINYLTSEGKISGPRYIEEVTRAAINLDDAERMLFSTLYSVNSVIRHEPAGFPPKELEVRVRTMVSPDAKETRLVLTLSSVDMPELTWDTYCHNTELPKWLYTCSVPVGSEVTKKDIQELYREAVCMLLFRKIASI